MNPYFTLLSFVLFFGKPSHQPISNSSQLAGMQIDTARVSVLKLTPILKNNYFEKGAKDVELSAPEIEQILLLTKQSVDNYNKKEAKKHPGLTTYAHGISDFGKYYKQIVAVTNSNGKKEVWVNCFCTLLDDNKSAWRENLVCVDDGGDCFFNLKINLTTGVIAWFRVNGVA